jgi:hypothetical protein
MVLGGTAVGAATMTGTAQAANPHPKIHAAISALQEARVYLNNASHNFGGHKKDALEHISSAIHQLKACLKY